MFGNCYKNKSVLLTGHTGFKGSWLTLWLESLGAEVHGYSLDIPSAPSHFETLKISDSLKSDTRKDVRSAEDIKEAIDSIKPDIVFHLAAEAIVSTCIKDPYVAFSTNLMGTVNVLTALKDQEHCKRAVFITSDKCYENVEWLYGYRENDRLGGKDPYSASKACAELAFSSFYRTYFANTDFQIATARAGNVIGGGDWAADRIVPDCIRSWSDDQAVHVRNPNATRPWQHVLEPLSGYLRLGQLLFDGKNNIAGESFNFGPNPDVIATVDELITEMKLIWKNGQVEYEDKINIGSKEANLLKLNCDKALTLLEWTPTLNFAETIKMTASWYKDYYQNSATSQSIEDINFYTELAKSRNKSWTK